MKKIRSLVLLMLLLTVAAAKSLATWSIIVIDPRTKQIGIAGASCTYSVYGIGGIIPGKGAIIVQAMSNKQAKRKGLEMIMANASPEQILEAIKDPVFLPELQQYAVVSLNHIGKPVTYSGAEIHPAQGTLTAKGISVQGNTLSNTGMLRAVLNAAIEAQRKSLSIEEVLMAALEAGAKFGGDKRCGERKASSAFLTVAQPVDDPSSPSLNLVVKNNPGNAVRALRVKFNRWKTRG